MEKNTKFVLGGILVVLSILTGDYFLSPWLDPYSGNFRRIILTLTFFIILLPGLNLLAESLLEK